MFYKSCSQGCFDFVYFDRPRIDEQEIGGWKQNFHTPYSYDPLFAPNIKEDNFVFKYVYSDGLKDCYVNGAWGGVTPRKEIHMHFYSERHPIPKSVIHKINKDGSPEKTGETVVGGDVVRLIQASVVMNLETAVAIRNFLNNMINIISEAAKEE